MEPVDMIAGLKQVVLTEQWQLSRVAFHGCYYLLFNDNAMVQVVNCQFPGGAIWNLWQRKWHWDRCFGFPCQSSFCQCYILIHLSSEEQAMGPSENAVPQMKFHTHQRKRTILSCFYYQYVVHDHNVSYIFRKSAEFRFPNLNYGTRHRSRIS